MGTMKQGVNQQLAKEIVDAKDVDSIKELIDNLHHKKRVIQGDCIKVLYEIGQINPDLIAPFAKEFIALLSSSNNRLQWGGMTALHRITPQNLELVFKALPQLTAIADAGTVITNDHFVGILQKLGAHPKYYSAILPVLMQRLKIAPENQLPRYAEDSLPILKSEDLKPFANIVAKRLNEIDHEPKRKRMEKVLAKVEKVIG